MSSLGRSVTRAARTRSWSQQILCRRRHHDQRTPAGSAGPRCTRALGGRSYPLAAQFDDRHLVERCSCFTMLLHLPRKEGISEERASRTGRRSPVTAPKPSEKAIVRSMNALPENLSQSLTWDQGAEMAQNARLRVDSGLQIYFCDPQSLWQCGSNENTNGLLRQYFPKGTDLSQHSARELDVVAHALNARPRKTLGGRRQQKRSTSSSPRSKAGVATTG